MVLFPTDQANGKILLMEIRMVPFHTCKQAWYALVSGVNGVLGVNVPKAVMEELNIDFALNSKMINLEGLSVQDKQMRLVHTGS